MNVTQQLEDCHGTSVMIRTNEILHSHACSGVRSPNMYFIVGVFSCKLI
ncbi:hypothetical protein WN944_027766 [Citrus x changshan-huyou]|uniref:Uncharacterized protein n=1 Tax=Citrus x changshan-huyou TaxID=2935761 RepID=A0AAP0QA64_9ROSI